jgi:hypothetical protein
MMNPYICYILGFVVSLLVYQLGWSEAYPRLSVGLTAFLLATLFAHFVLSIVWNKGPKRYVSISPLPKINPWVITAVLYLCWAADFIREGGIPLFKVFFHQPYDYKVFGVPMLHVFAVTFASFYCVYLFYYFLRTGDRRFLFIYGINMFAAILIYSRSMLFFNLASTFFLYLIYLNKVPYRLIFAGFPAIIGLFYFFGVVGTQRVSFENNVAYDVNLFLDNGKATDEFRSSIIPKEFFWPYIYISSPLANLQTNINTYEVKPITTSRVFEFINNEILFESISKRINKMTDTERENERTIKDPFNVSTVYSRGYSYLGWIGIFFTALVVIALPFAYKRMMLHNPHQPVGFAILCTTYLFLCYDNTIRLMALGFQLVYPVVFPWLENKINRD